MNASRAVARRRLPIDFVSPLPPVRSGIADYSVDLLGDLELLTDLRVIQLPGQEIAQELCERWSPVGFERLGEDGRLPLYQMGNNPYHERVYAAATSHPGVLTLHDVWLHHLLMERTLAHHDLEGYVSELERDHGWIGRAVAMAPKWGGYGQSGLFTLHAHRRLLEGQRAVIVHSDWARGVLAEEGIEAPVEVVPMPMPAPPTASLPDVAEARRRFGLSPEDRVLGSFGFQTPIKRTEVVVRALAEPGLERVRLLVAGELSDAVDVRGVAEELGVGDRVQVTGFLAPEEFTAAIIACDLCVNLRYPTAGETSASLLRFLALGRGAVVSDYAQFSDFPEDVVIKVPLQAVAETGEVGALAAALERVLAEPERVALMGRRARRLIESRHQPAASAAAIVEVCERWVDRRPRPGSAVTAAPPTSLTSPRLPARIEVAGADAWPPGERRRLLIRLHNRSAARWLAGDSGTGGLAVEIRFERPERQDDGGWASSGDEMARPWIPLPRDLPGGESVELELELRRPPGPCRLVVEPHVFGAGGLDTESGTRWCARIDGS